MKSKFSLYLTAISGPVATLMFIWFVIKGIPQLSPEQQDQMYNGQLGMAFALACGVYIWMSMRDSFKAIKQIYQEYKQELEAGSTHTAGQTAHHD